MSGKVVRLWSVMNTDPLLEKYYGLSPYVYCVE